MDNERTTHTAARDKGPGFSRGLTGKAAGYVMKAGGAAVPSTFPWVFFDNLKRRLLRFLSWSRRRLSYGFFARQPSATSTVSSASTGMFMGREATPKAQRACLPSSPNTSTIRSLRPLATCGCWVNSGVDAT